MRMAQPHLNSLHSGLRHPADGDEVIWILLKELQPVEVDGSLAWQIAGDTTAASAKPGGVLLLPYFDAYTVGCHPRRVGLSGSGRWSARCPAVEAGTFPCCLSAGWSREFGTCGAPGRKLDITVEPFDQLTAMQHRELAEQVERIGKSSKANPC